MFAPSVLRSVGRPLARLRFGRPSSSAPPGPAPTPTPTPTTSTAAAARRTPPPPAARTPSTPKASAKTESDYTPFLLLLAAVPVTCAYLAYWQVGRLKWKVELIEELEMNLGRKAIDLPDEIEHSVLPEFNYRKVALRGSFPPLDTPGMPAPILVGPRILDGEAGYQVVLPFLRSPAAGRQEDGAGAAAASAASGAQGWWSWLTGASAAGTETTGAAAAGDAGVVSHRPQQHEPKPILVTLGFVPSSLITPYNLSALRVPEGEVELEGMLRNKGLGKLSSAKEGKPTYWTPDNDEKGRNWYWVDTERFAEYFRNDAPGGWGEVEPVMVDVIYDGSIPKAALLETGAPVGRAPKIELRNQHAVYAFTWISISVITTGLLWRVWKTGRVIKPRSGRGGQ